MCSRHTSACVVALIFGTFIAACGGSTPETTANTTAPAAAGAQKIDPASTGELGGVITINGQAPDNAAIRMNADPLCARVAKGPQFQETFKVGADGKALANVFVYVKSGLGNYVYDAPNGPVTMTQEGCHYIPHVFGIRTGQPLEIMNGDDTMHNVHATAKSNQEFNQGQPQKGMKVTHTFTATELPVPFKCDVHAWMNAYVGVMDHPFFAVSDIDGKFSIKGLPAGTYTIEAWHERLGTMTQSVTIAAKESKELNFTMDVSKAAAATN